MVQEKLRSDLAILPIGTAIKLTGLTARQIRYYEANDLIKVARSQSKQRLFSLDNLQQLMEIKALMNTEHNLEQVRQLLARSKRTVVHSDSQLRHTLQDEILLASPFNRNSANYPSTFKGQN